MKINDSSSLCFVHGWAFDSNFWANLLKTLDIHGTEVVDLGFSSTPTDFARQNQPHPDYLITHSLGTLWALHQGIKPKKGMIVLNGFYSFVPFSTPETLDTMRQGVQNNLRSQMRAFWRQVGAGHDTPSLQSMDPDTLLQGLDWLAHWEVQDALAALDCPVLVLAGGQDLICPLDTMQEHWKGYDILVNKEAGHSLPQSHPEWCAQMMSIWMNAI